MLTFKVSITLLFLTLWEGSLSCKHEHPSLQQLWVNGCVSRTCHETAPSQVCLDMAPSRNVRASTPAVHQFICLTLCRITGETTVGPLMPTQLSGNPNTFHILFLGSCANWANWAVSPTCLLQPDSCWIYDKYLALLLSVFPSHLIPQNKVKMIYNAQLSKQHLFTLFKK